MRMLCAAIVFGGVASLAAPHASCEGGAPEAGSGRGFRADAVDAAEDLAKSKEWARAADLLLNHLKRVEGDDRAYGLLGTVLLKLDRKDEAAHYLDRAGVLAETAGRRSSALRSSLSKADPLTSKRTAFFKRCTRELFTAGERLADSDHVDRALDILERLDLLIQDGSRDKTDRKIRTLLGSLRATREEVDLESAATGSEKTGPLPLVVVDSEHYHLECNLEPEVVRLVADTMDDIHSSYVEVYFDGKARRAGSTRPTIRIHPTWDDMVAEWMGGAPSPGLGGWWSPGENRVVCYDTRDGGGDLDDMLRTLFHEASHQFMSLLSRGRPVPAWINEGTSTFFEGSVAMADHRVLWPDAAIARLQNLSRMLTSQTGPQDGARTVVSYASPGSYPGDYYAFGWGLIYFLQQWEDPETLTYPYRAYYARYREEILGKPSDSMDLFEEILLGEKTPLGHLTFDDFDRDWREWILDTVGPLHMGPAARRRELRMAEVQKYMAAADRAGSERKPPVPEAELLERALGHLEYVRTSIDGIGGHQVSDGSNGYGKRAAEVLLAEADVLERLDRQQGAAALIEQVLDLADEGYWAVSEEEHLVLEERLMLLDRRNWALRNARSRIRGLARTAQDILDNYLNRPAPLPLRASTFASQAARLLDDEELQARAGELRTAARAKDLILGRIVALAGSRSEWISNLNTTAPALDLSGGSIALATARPAGMIWTGLTIRGEYTVRTTVIRDGELHLGSTHGVVIAGAEGRRWTFVGFDRSGHIGVWASIPSSGSGMTTKKIESLYLENPIGEAVQASLSIQVFAGGHLRIVINESETVDTVLDPPPTSPCHVGLFVRDGRVRLLDTVVEIEG